jgi:biopolymer transport protein ExbD
MKVPLPTVKRRARIEIIPLIDIVFFLLATFVMVSLSMIQNKGISINLPQAASSTTQDEKSKVVISINQAGIIYLEKEAIDLDALKGRLKALKATNPDLRVIINGDDKAYFGTAVTILDEVRLLGIQRVAIQTKPKNSDGK